MSIFSFLSRLIGRRPTPSKPSSEERIEVTAEFNHKIGPIDRGERYEDPLDEELRQHHYGEIDGGGSMLTEKGEIDYIDVHMFLHSPENSIPFVIQFLEQRGAPKGSKLRIFDQADERVIRFGVREGFAIYLDGVNLPDEVYKTTDSNFVFSEINRCLAGHGEIEAHWQGPTETALYVYGDTNSIMKSLVADFMASYPLCRGARIVDLTS